MTERTRTRLRIAADLNDSPLAMARGWFVSFGDIVQIITFAASGSWPIHIFHRQIAEKLEPNFTVCSRPATKA
jgi:hypothetical protein